MAKVTVIIPYYNLGDFLNLAVESVINQTYKDWELIIVNDGSTDQRSIEILNQYENNKDKRIKVLHKKNSGLPDTRNYAIELSKSPYICCLDADDKYHEQFLEKTVNVLDKDSMKKFGFVTTNVQLFWMENWVQKFPKPNVVELLKDNVAHVASLFRKEAWKAAKGYKTSMIGYQDWDFWLSIVEKGYGWELIEEPLFFYRKRSSSMLSNSRKSDKELYVQMLNNHKKLFIDNFNELLLFNRNSLIETSQYIGYLNKEITKAQNVILDLQYHYKKNLEVRKELEVIKQAKIFKLRNALILLRTKPIVGVGEYLHLVKRLIQKVLRVDKLKNVRALYVENTKYEGPLVTIVVTVYNYGKYIDEAIESILSQGLENKVEIIIIEGFSNDGSREYLQNKHWPNTRIIFQPKRSSIGENRLLGFNEANGKYICSLDADDLLSPNYLKKALEVLEQGNYDVAYPDIQQFGEADKVDEFPEFSIFTLFKGGNIIAPASVFKRSFWKENDIGYNLGRDIFEDWDFWMRMAQKGARFKHFTGPKLIYRVHTTQGNSMTDSRNARRLELEEETLRSFREFIDSKEYWRAYQKSLTKFKVKNPNINLFWKNGKKSN